MLTININEAQERLLELIRQTQNGDGFIIADDDKPLVRVLPYEEPEKSRRLDIMRGQCVVPVPDDVKAVGREEIIAMFEGRE
ncbi:MAG: type II toxin-antitoxin system prevent-host-death family antitoxin [Deltaproteobacteria bacterium]|jgi:antitoxin (DNA-binding transcriptional repressor) of toxin-antitoxin stability system|nr:type II toxin-antitoxin system prevent-host-death family antitoxin [Deltaproteobacteria bacterium]